MKISGRSVASYITSDSLVRIAVWNPSGVPQNDEQPQVEANPDGVQPPARSCNRHKDCDEADRDTLLGHGRRADHCHEETCEDCYGY